MEDMSSESSVSCPHCLVCGEIVDVDFMNCPRCDTLHHRECWDYNCGCAVYGCREATLRDGCCTLCHRTVSDALRVPAVEIFTYDKAGRPPLAPALCSECSEAKILGGGGVPARAAAIVVLGGGVMLAMTGEVVTQSLGAWGVFFVVVGGLIGILWLLTSLVGEMGRNARELPTLSRSSSKGNKVRSSKERRKE